MSVDAGTSLVSLPKLPARSVPRRYEETRPVLIQGCAHSKIIGLGQELHKKELEKAENEKLDAIRAAEQAVWQEAERLKAIALDKAKEEAAIEQERVIKKLKKQHEKALLEEALKVEMAMQKLAIEQVKQERLEGEMRLKKAVAETEEKCRKELEAAVAKARNEERQIAKKAAEKAAEEARATLQKAMLEKKKEKEQALEELRDKKDIEKACMVKDAEERERKIANEKISALVAKMEKAVYDLEQQIKGKEKEIIALMDQKREVEKQKENVETCLIDTRKDFQDFIDNLPPYQKMQADFMLPSVYLDELEKKGYHIQPLRPPVLKKVKKKK